MAEWFYGKSDGDGEGLNPYLWEHRNKQEYNILILGCCFFLEGVDDSLAESFFALARMMPLLFITHLYNTSLPMEYFIIDHFLLFSECR